LRRFDNATLRKTCTLKADDRAAFSQSVFIFTLKTAHCRVAHSMHEVPCLNNCDWYRDRKTALVFTGAADAAFTAGALLRRTLRMKGK